MKQLIAKTAKSQKKNLNHEDPVNRQNTRNMFEFQTQNTAKVAKIVEKHIIFFRKQRAW